MKCNICGGEIPEGYTQCKYCGNIVSVEPKPENSTGEESIRERTEIPGIDSRSRDLYRNDVDVPGTEYVYRQTRRTSDLFCTKCGRPLDGVTGHCIVCDRKAVGGQMYMSEEYRREKYRQEKEREIMAQRKNSKKKKKHTFRNAVILIFILIIVFALTLLFTVGPLARILGIGGGNRDITPIEDTTNTTTTLPVVSTWAPQTDAPKPTEKPTSKPTQKPTEKPVEKDPVEERGGEYLYPSHTHLITEEELEEMTRSEIKYIYWEIYARHGYTFDDEMADYFEMNHRWYKPVTSDMEEVENEFNDIEKKNERTIFTYQKSQGWR